jgi:negative regulator of flagellin synthesis FlgM
MTEKINGQGFRPADTAGTRRTDAAKPASAQGGHRAEAAEVQASGDQVSITPAGLALAKLQELVQSTPVVDSERVAALKDAIANGSYEIDDQRVADRLLRFERDVLG